MSPLRTSSTNVVLPIKNESLYKSPPSSISDQSQNDLDTSRGRSQEEELVKLDKTDKGSDAEKENGLETTASGKPRKRKRSRKGLDSKYECPHHDCGKSYSRAEHLYRHQLNHSPKQIYVCDFPDCERKFVRQDLCTRHRERHTNNRGSQLQRKENYVPNSGGSALSSPVPSNPDHSTSSYRPSSSHASVTSGSRQMNSAPHFPPLEIPVIPARSPLPGHVMQSQQLRPKDLTPLETRLKSPGSYGTPQSSEYSSTTRLDRISSDGHYYSGPTPPGYDSSNRLRTTPVSTFDPHQRHASFGAVNTIRSQKGSDMDQRSSRPSTQSLTSPAMYRVSPTTSYATQHPYGYVPQPHMQNGSGNGAFIPHQDFPAMSALPPPVYAPITQPSPRGAQPSYTTNPSGFGSVVTPLNMEIPGPTLMDSQYIDQNKALYSTPVFGGEGYSFSRSPFAMADDFAAWLLNDSHYVEASPDHRRGSRSFGSTAFMESPSAMSGAEDGATNGHYGQSMPPQHPMDVNSILDSTVQHTILSEEKRQKLLKIIEHRFNETDHAPVMKQKEALLDGDPNVETHVMSLQSLRTYIGSYWYHFHPQMPILHEPTFVADKAQNLLLIAIIAIGASCLDKMHGYEVTKAGADLSNFLAWHLRWEILKDKDFRPPAELWVFQALLLLEVYEKMYSTRVLHERAHIHHGTTLTLMRRGSSLIGRSLGQSPADLYPNIKADRFGSGTDGAITPDQWWNNWITNEATRRVAFAAFITDSIHTTMFGHTAVMVAHEMRLPLPCDESLWSATSGADVGRMEASLEAAGVKPLSFYDGLRKTLKNQPVQTNSFGRTAIMAGLLNVSWHMHQRDLQVRNLGALKAFNGKDVWRGSLTRAFDTWKTDFDEHTLKDVNTMPRFYQPPGKLDEENLFESKTVLHHLAHMAMHVDIVDCQIFAKANQLLGRTITQHDYATAQRRIREHWAPKPSARDATWYALKFLAQVLVPDSANVRHNSSVVGMSGSTDYSARDDFLLNRPWVLYFAALVVWSYGYALDGPIRSPPILNTPEEQTYDMRMFLRRVGGVDSPENLTAMHDRNACMGMLLLLRDKFKECRWELLHESANLLTNCIEMLKGTS
ncbi:hypothetical protein MMC12_002134 [Toensbergia leucococca]|nr:hypothetical protein [Toensbergia leucococca]